MTPTLQIRESTSADYPLIESWAAHHRRASFDSRAVPPTSFMIEDEKGPLLFGKVYLSVGVGVAFADGLFSRPWEAPETISAAFGFWLEAVKKILAAHDYGMLVGYTFPAMARIGESLGMMKTNTGLVQLLTSTREVEHG